MSKIFAYLRTSTDKQDLDQQRLQILDYARTRQLHVDEFVAITISLVNLPKKDVLMNYSNDFQLVIP